MLKVEGLFENVRYYEKNVDMWIFFGDVYYYKLERLYRIFERN